MQDRTKQGVFTSNVSLRREPNRVRIPAVNMVLHQILVRLNHFCWGYCRGLPETSYSLTKITCHLSRRTFSTWVESPALVRSPASVLVLCLKALHQKSHELRVLFEPSRAEGVGTPVSKKTFASFCVDFFQFKA